MSFKEQFLFLNSHLPLYVRTKLSSLPRFCVQYSRSEMLSSTHSSSSVRKCLVTDLATWHPLSHCGILTKKLFSNLVGNSRNLNGLVRLAMLEVRATCQRKEWTASQQRATFSISSLRLDLVASNEGYMRPLMPGSWAAHKEITGQLLQTGPEEREIPKGRRF